MVTLYRKINVGGRVRMDPAWSSGGGVLDISPSMPRHLWRRTRAGTARCTYCFQPMRSDRFAISPACSGKQP